MDVISQPWPWYIAGPLIGLMVPLLLLIGNKALGISSSLRHICAACIPLRVPFFNYDWKQESWNLFFVGGVLVGGIVAAQLLTSSEPVVVDIRLQEELATYGIRDYTSLVPQELFNFQELITIRGFVLMVVGGFLVGFGTRYAGGCTSGHSIMGLSTLQWPSLVTTCCFMLGGMIVANFILPLLMNL